MKIKNKLNKRLFSFALCLVIGAFSTVTVFADGIGTSIKESEEMPYKSYTYWSNYNTDEKTAAYSKPMYRIDSVRSLIYRSRLSFRIWRQIKTVIFTLLTPSFQGSIF